MNAFQTQNKSGILFSMFFIVGVLSLFWGVSDAFAECSDNDGGDDPYTISTYPSATADSFLAILETAQHETCRSDGTQYVVHEFYCDGTSSALDKTYYCDSCAPTVCLEKSEVTVTNTYEDADGSSGAGEIKIKAAVSRYTEVVETASSTMISSGHHQSCVDSCDTKSLGKIKECQVAAGALVTSTLYCPKGLACSDGACK